MTVYPSQIQAIQKISKPWSSFKLMKRKINKKIKTTKTETHYSFQSYSLLVSVSVHQPVPLEDSLAVSLCPPCPKNWRGKKKECKYIQPPSGLSICHNKFQSNFLLLNRLTTQYWIFHLEKFSLHKRKIDFWSTQLISHSA